MSSRFYDDFDEWKKKILSPFFFFFHPSVIQYIIRVVKLELRKKQLYTPVCVCVCARIRLSVCTFARNLRRGEHSSLPRAASSAHDKVTVLSRAPRLTGESPDTSAGHAGIAAAAALRKIITRNACIITPCTGINRGKHYAPDDVFVR